MSDGEEPVADAVAEKPVVTAEPVLGEPMDILTGLQLVLKKSLAHDGLARGLHEAAKAIEKHAAQLCVLAEDCNQPDYSKLVQALCSEHNVNLISVPSAKKLGEWVGLCKIDSEGKARKVVGCSCVVVKVAFCGKKAVCGSCYELQNHQSFCWIQLNPASNVQGAAGDLHAALVSFDDHNCNGSH